MLVGGGRDDEEVLRKLKSMDVDKMENGGGGGEAESPRPAVKYHGWKAMPFIIGACACCQLPLSVSLSLFSRVVCLALPMAMVVAAAGWHRHWLLNWIAVACPYGVRAGNETFEKLGTLGTSANLLVYLTQVFHMRSVDAATLLNGLNGTTSLAPIVGAFLSDAYLGRYLALAIASIASLIVSAISAPPLVRVLP
jgi:hypothetical protein